MKEKILTSVENLDKAAVLVTMGFVCHGRHVVKDVDLDSQTGRRHSAYIWDFETVSVGGLKLEDVCAEYAVGMPCGRVLKPLGAVGAARLALHNYRVLRTALRNGAPVWADDLLGCVRLGNYPGPGESRAVERVAAVSGGCRADYAAVLAAVGYMPESWSCAEGKVQVRMTGRPEQAPVAARVMMLRDEVWLKDPQNLEPLAVGLLAIRNRGLLLGDEAGETLRVSKNGLVGLVRKSAGELAMRGLCERMNL